MAGAGLGPGGADRGRDAAGGRGDGIDAEGVSLEEQVFWYSEGLTVPFLATGSTARPTHVIIV